MRCIASIEFIEWHRFIFDGTKTIATKLPMKIDLNYFACFSFAQFLLFSPVGISFLPIFASYNFIAWAVFCASGVAAYPWLRSSLDRSTRLRFSSILGRLALIFVASTALSFAIIGSMAPDHFSEWTLGLFFISVPSALASIVSISVSYTAFRLIHKHPADTSRDVAL